MSYSPGGSGTLSDQYVSAPTSDAVDSSTSVRTTITATASATPHTAGSWVEIDPSIAANSSGVMVHLSGVNTSNTNTSTLLDIGTGGSGSEVVWATIGVGYSVTNGPFRYVPGFIASGTRVSVRARSAVASQAVIGVFSILTAKSTQPSAPITIGADTANSRGVVLTAPGSLNTKSAWTEITSSTSGAIGNLLVCPQAASGTAMNTSGVLIDIGTGASGSESVLIGDIYLAGSSSEFYTPRSPLTYGVSIPAGTRVAARFARAATGNAVDLVLVGA